MSLDLLPGHRRLRARATVRTMPMSIRKGSQVFRKPAQLERDDRKTKVSKQACGDVHKYKSRE